MIWPLIKVVVVYIVVFVPSPKIMGQEGIEEKAKNCSREGSSIVRHFLQTAFKPIFKKFEVKIFFLSFHLSAVCLHSLVVCFDLSAVCLHFLLFV